MSNTTDFSFVLSDPERVWSYSQLRCFSDCKYRFFLSYILNCEDAPLFFAQFGSFIHELLRSFYAGEVSADDLTVKYLTGYCEAVNSPAPSFQIAQSAFQKGLAYMQSFCRSNSSVVAVEQEYEFMVGKFKFIGYIDLVERTPEGLVITDHKSYELHPRSTGKKLKRDDELDRYLQQLYLYAHALHESTGEFPAFLKFNCFKAGTEVVEPFCMEDYLKTLEWAEDTIDQIINTTDWEPCIDYFSCKNICGFHRDCEWWEIGA